MFQLSFGVKFISRSTTVPESQSILENKGALSPPPSIRSPSTPGIVLAMLTMVWRLRSSWVKILENAWFEFFELGMTQKKSYPNSTTCYYLLDSRFTDNPMGLCHVL